MITLFIGVLLFLGAIKTIFIIIQDRIIK